VLGKRMYLETMEEILRGTNKVIIEGNPGGGQGVVPYLPLDKLQPPSAAPAPAKAGQQRSQ